MVTAILTVVTTAAMINNQTVQTWRKWLLDQFQIGKNTLSIDDLQGLIGRSDKIINQLPLDETKFTRLKWLIENDVPTAFDLQGIIEVILQPIYLGTDPETNRTIIEEYPITDSRIITAALIAVLESEQDYEELYYMINEVKLAAAEVVATLTV
jgi:hypothetical protein